MERVFLTGYTPYPLGADDKRLPHLAAKLDRQIHKTALGAEKMVAWEHHENIETVLLQLEAEGFAIAAVEQAPRSIPLPDFKPRAKIALLVGREVEGIEPELLAQADLILEIPMLGQKESFNVVQAAAIALYHCRFLDLT